MGRELEQRVSRLATHRGAKSAAARHGLDIVNVSWEDNGRTKGSCWGPCISDMTLNCENQLMPAVRYPNFSDLTFDIPTELFTVMVGNEKNSMLRPVSLKEYLSDINKYTNPSGKKIPSLYCPQKDKEVLVSAQSTFLPADKKTNPEFDVQLFNYQTTNKEDPKLLTILATSHGTSAQLLRERSQKLYHNANGKAIRHKAVRLSKHRNDGKATNLQTVMTKEEKAMNVLMIIQVPIVTTNAPAPTARRMYKSASKKSVPGVLGAMGGLFGGFGAASKACGAAPISYNDEVSDAFEEMCDVFCTASDMPSPPLFAAAPVAAGPPPPPAPSMFQQQAASAAPSLMEDFEELEGDDDFDLCDTKDECADEVESEEEECECSMAKEVMAEEVSQFRRSSRKAAPEKKKVNKKPEAGTGSEHAILQLGSSSGSFPGFGKTEFRRDERFPLRVTMQFYKVTDTDELSNEDFKSMVEQIKQARSAATAIGSLVVDGHTGRTTEMTAEDPWVPDWWESFFLLHKRAISLAGMTEQDALRRVRLNMPRREFTSMSETESVAVKALNIGNVQMTSPAVFTSALF